MNPAEGVHGSYNYFQIFALAGTVRKVQPGTATCINFIHMIKMQLSLYHMHYKHDMYGNTAICITQMNSYH